MKQFTFLKIAAILAGAVVAGQASAHVGYGSALFIQAGGVDPIGSKLTAGNVYAANTFNIGGSYVATASSNAGYLTGLDSNAFGNTHDVRFRYFVLSQNTEVKFDITGTTNSNGADVLNPAYSLYTNILPPTSHDGVGDVPAYAADANIQALLASESGFASWSPFAALDPVIAAAKAAASVDPASQTNDKWGSFLTAGDVTTGNNGVAPGGAAYSYQYGGIGATTDNTPTVGTIHYTGISGADAAVGATFNTISGGTGTVLNADGVVDHVVHFDHILGPGVYTLAVDGANIADNNQYIIDTKNGGALVGSAYAAAYGADRLARGFAISNVSLTAPVPEPEQWVMMMLGLSLLGMSARRKQA